MSLKLAAFGTDPHSEGPVPNLDGRNGLTPVVGFEW